MEELANHNADVDGDGGDAPTLSSQALAALQEFLREQSQSPAEQSEVALVTEDWRLSQFWYDRETAETVANEVLALCSGSPSRVACIACPTLYAYLKDQRELLVDVIAYSLQLQRASVSLWLIFLLLPSGVWSMPFLMSCFAALTIRSVHTLSFGYLSNLIGIGLHRDSDWLNATRANAMRIDPSVSVQLLEYDKRFERYGSDFTFYDYNQPEELPTEMKHAFQVIVADPPYLSGECLEKVAQTISFLSRSQTLTCFYLQEKFKRIELQNFLVCIHAYSGLSIPASLGMSFAYSLTTIQGRDWEDGSKRNR
ncbi:hypothetical protein NL676_016712 [Syzygium grande]|nr:hypothetical protein NL676_016712 [Syzygium grande]